MKYFVTKVLLFLLFVVSSIDMRASNPGVPCVWKGCTQVLSTPGNMRVHVRTVHQKNKRFECSICGKRFTTRCNMQTHKRTHDNQQPFACPICGRKFSQKGNKNRHILSHKEPPLKCRWGCPKKFTSKGNKSKHEKKCKRHLAIPQNGTNGKEVPILEQVYPPAQEEISDDHSDIELVTSLTQELVDLAGSPSHANQSDGQLPKSPDLGLALLARNYLWSIGNYLWSIEEMSNILEPSSNVPLCFSEVPEDQQ